MSKKILGIKICFPKTLGSKKSWEQNYFRRKKSFFLRENSFLQVKALLKKGRVAIKSEVASKKREIF